MRILVLITTLLISQIAMAKPASPVTHVHSGRTHSHPLPQQGLAHRHGSLGLGVAVSAGKSHSTKRTKPSQANSNMVLGGTTSIINKTIKKNIKGDVNCNLGAPDCNTCAANVQQQFQKAANGQLVWRNKPWRFTWPQPYPPNNLQPLDIFDGEPVHALGIPDTHVQGFVRTNSSRYPYAGSHSHKQRGGIFIINQLGDGKKYLETLHATKSKHPSGVHVLGKYLLYGDNNSIVFKDINSPNQQQDIVITLPRRNNLKPAFGGGIGVLKLTSNEHLLVMSSPGGQDKRPRISQFYRLHSVNGRPHHLTFMNQSRMIKPPQWSRQLIYSENMTLVTECGTGDIYAMHTSGDQKGLGAVKGNGYWRLSKLIQDQNKLSFRAVSAFITRQNMSSCNVRATATAFVTPQHKLELYCHGYAKDPQGSAFNVLGQSNSRNDKFYFRVGVIQ